jgi:probable F420-dependent oxidoreductase
MELGVLTFVTERGLPVTELARACEERGLDSLWVPEHPVVPVHYETRYPLTEDGKLPRPYTELPDQFAVLTAAAAVTTKLRVGTGICLVPERDAVMTAHQVASVDFLSGGRFLFGIGAGWLEEEMRLFTPHFPYRFAFMREAIAAMRKLWTEDVASFEGKYIRFPGAVCRPKPASKPHPPVLIGGMGPNALKRVGTYGDGWLPIGVPPDGVREAKAEIARVAREKGRDPEKISITAMLGAPPGMEEPMLDALPPRDVVAAYRDAGAERVVVSLPTLRGDEALRHLDRVAAALPA